MRWLMDFASAGVSERTPIDQACSSLQVLINGVRGGWFDEGHPAHGWSVVGSAENAEQVRLFEQQWSWLDSYGRWQAAVLNYLYPENVLFPELLEAKGTYLEGLLSDLGNLQPLSADSKAFVALRDTVPKDVKSNDYYFGHVALGLALQRAGLYAAALDSYRQVYDTSKASPVNRPKAALLKAENNNPPEVVFRSGWTLDLTSPHKVAGHAAGQPAKSGSQNPYCRFTLFQILRCTLAQADEAFASGTWDGRARALALYLEANDILRFEELQDLQPSTAMQAMQAYLPSPVLASMRAHTASALSKLRRGLSYLGTPMPPDMTRGPGGGALSSLVRPTPYRYRVLMERAKQLTAQAQQLESQYLAALEHGDAETEKFLSSGFGLDIAQKTVDLKALQATEAGDGMELARRQQTRSQMQSDRYREWIAAGQTQNERAQIENIWAATAAKGVIAGLDANISIGQHMESMTSNISSVLWWKWVIAGAIDVQVTARAVTQGFANDYDTKAQVSGILASQERRTQEWLLQRDLSLQDVKIIAQQITLAQDRINIAVQESAIAKAQFDHASQMLTFLSSKFTSAAFYQWYIGELSQVYGTFLRLATVTAQHAELQLAFERQERPVRLIKTDYWLAASSAAASSSTSSGPTGAGRRAKIDPRGITGSTRLLQDLYTLDEHAFSSERRLLNLSQNFSLSRLMPVEFEDFRRTGLLAFSTPMQWFDEGFPGHYIRLIKKVRVSVAALIPPGIGVRATLANGGLSRVVTADPGNPTMVIRQDPQLVALTSPAASSGVFELDIQSDLLYPFEGTGVNTTWYFELPPAGNPFDFDSLIDVVLSIDYTAQFSPELRDRVIKSLPREFSGDRTFSIRRDFPDLWYELSNGTKETIEVVIPLSKRAFPPGLRGIKVVEASVSIRTTEGIVCKFVAALAVREGISNPPVQSVRGIVSSRQSGGSTWRAVIDSSGEVTDASTDWKFTLSNAADVQPEFLAQLHNGKVDDILVIITFSGMRPSW